MLMSLCKLKKKTNLLTTFDLPLHEIVIEPSSFSSYFQDFFFIFKIFKAWPTDKQDSLCSNLPLSCNCKHETLRFGVRLTVSFFFRRRGIPFSLPKSNKVDEDHYSSEAEEINVGQ